MKDLKFVLMGVSGSGKSSFINSLTDNNLLSGAIPKTHTSGTTTIPIEYVFRRNNTGSTKVEDFNFVKLSKTSYQTIWDGLQAIKGMKQYFAKYSSEETKPSLENIKIIILEYLKSIENTELLFDLINYKENHTPSDETLQNWYTIFTLITITNIKISVPPSKELNNFLTKGDIESIILHDTRGTGDRDEVKQHISYHNTDGIITFVIGTTPNNHEALIKLCRKNSHIPMLFVLRHPNDEDGIMCRDTSDYVEKLKEFTQNTRQNLGDKHEFYKSLKETSNFIEPVKKIIDSFQVNYVPTISDGFDSNYYQAYQIACLEVLQTAVTAVKEYNQITQSLYNLLDNFDAKSFSNAVTKIMALDELLNKRVVMKRTSCSTIWGEYIDYVILQLYFQDKILYSVLPKEPIFGQVIDRTASTANYAVHRDLYETIEYLFSYLGEYEYTLLELDPKTNQLLAFLCLRFLDKSNVSFEYINKLKSTQCTTEFLNEIKSRSIARNEKEAKALKLSCIKIFLENIFNQMKQETNLHLE